MRTAPLRILLGVCLLCLAGAYAQEGPGKKPEGEEKPEPAPPPDLQSLLIGETRVDGNSSVRIDYDFEDSAQLMDWERVGGKGRLSSGRLSLAEGSVLIHRLPFAGEMRVEVTARRMRSLSVELAGNGETEGTGYLVSLTAGRPGRLQVIRAGDVWVEKEVDASGPRAATVALGDGVLIVTVDGEEILRETEKAPLTGTRILIGSGEKSVQLESLSIVAGFDAMAVRNARLKRPLPPERWVPLIGAAGLDDFYTGKSWTLEDGNGTLLFKGNKGSEGWCVYRRIDTVEVGSYTLEAEVMTDSPRWSKRKKSGYVFVSFAVAGKEAVWAFTNQGSQLRALDQTRNSMSLSQGRWHTIRIVVKGRRSEGLLDGRRVWTMGSVDRLEEYDNQDRRWFGFGGERGPLSFRNVRLKVSAPGH